MSTFGAQQEDQIREALWLLNSSSHHYTVGRRPKNSGLFDARITDASRDGNQFTIVTDRGSLTVTFGILQISLGLAAGTMTLYTEDGSDDALIIENGRFSSVRTQEEHEARVHEAFRRLGWEAYRPQGFLE